MAKKKGRKPRAKNARKRVWTASEMGRKGGKKGGKARQRQLTAAQRSALGLQGSDKRWGKKRKKRKKKSL